MKTITQLSAIASLGLLPILSFGLNTEKKKPNVLFILADDFGIVLHSLKELGLEDNTHHHLHIR